MCSLFEETIQTEDVPMDEAALESNLEGKLVNHEMRLNHGLRDLFQRYNQPAPTMPCQVHYPELSFSQFLPDGELISSHASLPFPAPGLCQRVLIGR